MDCNKALSMAYTTTNTKKYAVQFASMISKLALDINDARAYFDTRNPATLETEKACLNLLKNVMQFNPQQLITTLLQKHKDMAQNIEAFPDALKSVSGKVMDRDQGRSILVYTNNETFHNNIQFVCWIFIIHKTPFDIKNKNSKLIVEIMDILKHKYDIKLTKGKPGVSLRF